MNTSAPADSNATGEIRLWLEGSEEDLLAIQFLEQHGTGIPSVNSGPGSSGHLYIELKKYCRLVIIDGDFVLYDSLNMNTFKLSPALGGLLKQALSSIPLGMLLQDVPPEAKENETSREQCALLALILLASLKTLTIEAR